MKKDNRIELIRILAITLVVLLHITNRYLLKYSTLSGSTFIVLTFINSLTRVSVPLFFMISGIVNIPKEYDKKKHIDKVFRMIIILIVWTLVYYFLDNDKVTDLIHSFFSYIRPHLWYMYALIGLYIVNPFISKMVLNFNEKEEKLFVNLWLGLCGFYYLIRMILMQYGYNTEITHPIPLINAAYYFGYYVSGYLIYKNYKKFNKNMSIFFVISILCLTINALLTSFFSFRSGSYNQVFFGYSNILIMIPSIFVLLFHLNHYKDKEYKIINIICPYIFGMYLCHVKVLDGVIHCLKINNTCLSIFVTFILVYLISYTISFILKHIPYINKYLC